MAEMTEAVERQPASPPTPELDPISQKLRSLQIKGAERRGGSKRGWGRLLFLAILGLAGGAAYVAYQEYQKQQVMESPPTEALTFGTRAGRGVIIEQTGFIVPKTKISIAPQAAGQITFLPVQEGMVVKKGDILCKIEEDRYQAEVDRSQAQLQLAQAQHDELINGALPEEIEQVKALHDTAVAREEQTKTEYDRVKSLFDGGNASKSALDTANVAFLQAQADTRTSKAKLDLINQKPRPEKIAVAQAQVDQAKAALKQAQFLLDNAIIKAPIDGTILEKNAQEGELILPETVIKSFCVLADMSHLEAEVDIQERDVARVNVGHPCQVIPDAYPELTYEAELDRMQPIVNRQRGVIPVKVRILKPDDRLLADMNCRVLFLKKVDSTETSIPTLPSRAIVNEAGKTVVYVLEGTVARSKDVVTGRTIGDEVEVTGGLSPGQIVLLPGDVPIKDGDTINPKMIDVPSADEP